ncbi:MAG: formyltetrahydrofolate deformylase [Bacteroidota bacterium]
MTKNTAILLINCPDKKGLVAAVTDFLHRNNGNVVSLDQHVDHEENQFFMRIEFELDGFLIPAEKVGDYFNTLLAAPHNMQWELYLTNRKPRMAVFVTKMSHCLYDILQRYKSGEWGVEIPIIISNHINLKKVADRFDIEFRHFPINKENKLEQEQAQVELCKELGVDFVVLARYMQILTGNFINAFPNKIINIHHSFLPAFKGAKPYHSAHSRGVKIIGATSHYVTEDLDEGPIIVQDVRAVSHKDSVKDMIRKGKDMEKVVLSQAIWLELQHKVLPYKNRTIVF